MSDNTEFDITDALTELIELSMSGNQASAIDLANKIEEAHKHAVEHCKQGDKVAEMRNALEAVSGMFWVEQTTKNEIYESIHYPGPNKFNRQSLSKHIFQLLRELDGEVFENNIIATPQPSTDVSDSKVKAERYSLLRSDSFTRPFNVVDANGQVLTEDLLDEAIDAWNREISSD